MKYLNWLKRILKFPFMLIMTPFLLIISFFCTDWENENDIKYTKDFFKNWFK